MSVGSHICDDIDEPLAARTFVSAWMSTMRVHEMMAENRLRFAQRLNEMSEELATIVKEVDKNRKQVRRCSISISPT